MHGGLGAGPVAWQPAAAVLDVLHRLTRCPGGSRRSDALGGLLCGSTRP